uniref:Uncharacterized protein n=1 Tax=Trichobilharzia regenti TaxID=157069 RepID=A0AA85J515_TRIRE|nr:unnamed protein product [Trichobilharzia regenti]
MQCKLTPHYTTQYNDQWSGFSCLRFEKIFSGYLAPTTVSLMRSSQDNFTEIKTDIDSQSFKGLLKL